MTSPTQPPATSEIAGNIEAACQAAWAIIGDDGVRWPDVHPARADVFRAAIARAIAAATPRPSIGGAPCPAHT